MGRKRPHGRHPFPSLPRKSSQAWSSTRDRSASRSGRDDEAVVQKTFPERINLDLIGRLHGGGWYSRVTDRFELPRISVEEWAKRKAAKAAE